MWSVLPEQQCVAIARGWRLLFHRHPGPPAAFCFCPRSARTTRRSRTCARSLSVSQKREREIRNWLFTDMSCCLFVSWLLLSRGPFPLHSLNNATGRSRGFIWYVSEKGEHILYVRSTNCYIVCMHARVLRASEQWPVWSSDEVKLPRRDFFLMLKKYKMCLRKIELLFLAPLFTLLALLQSKPKQIRRSTSWAMFQFIFIVNQGDYCNEEKKLQINLRLIWVKIWFEKEIYTKLHYFCYHQGI